MTTTIGTMPSGIPNLDPVLGGGFPAHSLITIGGSPGTGKTILAQQALFELVRRDPDARGLYLGTLSEPTVKVVRHMQQFAFFDPDAFGERIIYQDIGIEVRTSLDAVMKRVLELVREHRPDALVVDSFKAIHDLAPDAVGFRHFCYDLSISLAGERCLVLLVGEWGSDELADGVEFAIADGIVQLGTDIESGEVRRFLQVRKLRGAAPSMERHPVAIDDDGIRVIGSAIDPQHPDTVPPSGQLATGIPGMDDLLDGGLPAGHAVLLSGSSGTGKTTFSLAYVVHGAMNGERGLYVSFEETVDRLRATASAYGWDLAALEAEGLVRMVHVPQTSVRIEEHLEEMARHLAEVRPARFVIDSFSVFLHRVQDRAVQREKAYQVATLVRGAGAGGLLVSDVLPTSRDALSRYGVEETVADGVIVLSSELHAGRRRRYVEVYKLRGSRHIPGRHRIEIGPEGLDVFYVPVAAADGIGGAPRLTFSPLQPMVPDGIRYGSCWLVRGEPGVGKSALAQQFAAEGLASGDSVLYVSTDAPAGLLAEDLSVWGVNVGAERAAGKLILLDTHPGGDGDHFDLNDPDRFLYNFQRKLSQMPKPARVVVDTLTPFAIQFSGAEFLAFAEVKNRTIRRPDVVVLDTITPQTLPQETQHALRNGYDVVVDLTRPDWGEMGHHEHHARAIAVSSARGTRVDPRPYPFHIVPGPGILLEESFDVARTGR